MRLLLSLILIACAGCTLSGGRTSVHSTEEAPRVHRINDAIARGVVFLVKNQNEDGSWGTGTESHGNEVMVAVPASHDSFRIATTALCVMALREAGEKEAHVRGVEYLLRSSEARRETSELLYNIWAHTYAVQALSGEIRHNENDNARLKKVIAYHIDRMARYETHLGGWNYYDFKVGAQRPSGDPTSFGTSAALVAFWEARQAGVDVPQVLIDRAVRRMEDLRLPDGAYLYSFGLRYRPALDANRPRGSLGRTQAGNLSLMLWDSPKVDTDICRSELDRFFDDHGALEMGRKKPYPHESWYQTSGYYYYFGQYYAGRVVELLGETAANANARLSSIILAEQETDGSWWDYIMWDYHKPYGTAFAIMTLTRCR